MLKKNTTVSRQRRTQAKNKKQQTEPVEKEVEAALNLEALLRSCQLSLNSTCQLSVAYTYRSALNAKRTTFKTTIKYLKKKNKHTHTQTCHINAVADAISTTITCPTQAPTPTAAPVWIVRRAAANRPCPARRHNSQRK